MKTNCKLRKKNVLGGDDTDSWGSESPSLSFVDDGENHGETDGSSEFGAK